MRLSPITLLMLLSSVAQASATQAENDIFSLSIYELLQLEVTSSSYFDTLPLETANSVTVVQASQWDALGVRDLTELLATFPSTTSQYVLGNATHLAFRGYYNFNSSKGIAVEMDGIPLNSFRQTAGTRILAGLSLDGLERIEQVRGSSSAIYGANAFHGVIALHSINPKPGGTYKVALGSQREYSVSAGHHIDQGRHSFSSFINAQTIGSRQQSYPYLVGSSKSSAQGQRSLEDHSYNLILKYKYQPTSALELKLNGYFSHFDINQLPAFGNSDTGVGLDDEDWSDYKSQWLATKAELNYQQTDSSDLSFDFYYWKNKDDLELDFTPFFGFDTSESREESHWGAGVVQRQKLVNGAELAYGYQYKHAKLDLFSILYQEMSGAETLSVRPESGESSDTHSLFLDGRYPFSLTSTLAADWVFGVRADRYQEFDLQISPRLGLLLYPSAKQAVKFLYGHAFRKPDIIERSGSSVLEQSQLVQPENTDSVEIIFQHTELNYQYSITLFWNRWHDSISIANVETAEGEIDRQYRNFGKNSAYGTELEGRYDKGSWQLEGSLSWVRSQNETEHYDYEGFPDFGANINLSYQTTPTLSLHWFNQYHYREAASVDTTGSPFHTNATHFWKSNLSAHWRLSPAWQLKMEVRNIFDRDNFYPSNLSHLKGLPDDGRNAGFYLTYTH